jgi:imidazolonepropionase-like amidohydrolase
VEPPRIAAVLPPDAPAAAFPPGAVVLDARGHLVVPGLVDAHTHLLTNPGDADPDGDYERALLKVSLPLRTLRAAANARSLLDHGFTTVRDLGTEGAGYADVALRDAIAEGSCDGPRVVPAGPGIGVTGGYLPAGAAPGVHLPSGCTLADGPDAIRREVRAQVSHGVEWIKAFADWYVRPAVPGRRVTWPTFTREELAALVDEASRRGRRVAAHATGEEAARLASECGAASIEHLHDLSRETLDLLAARGTFLVPTLSGCEHRRDGATGPTRAFLDRRFGEMAAAFGRALASGVRIANGSDIGAFPYARGPMGEIRLLMDLGMTPLAALRAATREAAALLERPDLGVLEPAARADLCAFPSAGGDLRAALLGGPPALVVQGGRVVRGSLPAADPVPA